MVTGVPGFDRRRIDFALRLAREHSLRSLIDGVRTRELSVDFARGVLQLLADDDRDLLAELVLLAVTGERVEPPRD